MIISVFFAGKRATNSRKEIHVEFGLRAIARGNLLFSKTPKQNRERERETGQLIL
jgi:hypothetical protein